MEIKLKKLSLTNFKGIKELSIDLSNQTNVFGANATGKTTIFDAFTWLLFNKDSQGNTSFEVKTLDNSNNVISHLEHIVEGVIEIEGKIVLLRKVHTQKWVKKRGFSEPTLEGSENSFYWNDVPLKEKEYHEKLKELIEPELFTLITNPSKFNSLNWKDMRNILFKMAGDITDSEIINKNKKLHSLQSILEDKSLDEYKKEILVKKNKLKKDMEAINPRIDEVFKSIVEVHKPEFEKPFLEEQIKIIDENLLNIQKAYDEHFKRQLALNKQISTKKLEIQQAECDFEGRSKEKLREQKNTLQELEGELKSCTNSIRQYEKELKNYVEHLEFLNQELTKLRSESIAIQQEQFVFNESCSCPTCNQKLPAEDIENKRKEMESNFNKAKVKKYEEIKKLGLSKRESIHAMETEIEKLTKLNNERLNRKAVIETKIKDINALIAIPTQTVLFKDTDTYKNLYVEIEDLLANREEFNDTKVKARKEELFSKRESLNEKLLALSKYELIIQDNSKKSSRILELEQQEKDIAQTIAELERQEFLLEEFSRDKINHTEEKINSMFRLAKFKMFHKQVNGGISECCETTYLGVPYGDLNTASKINVGLDIINALTGFYDVTAPIFIDNRESVTEIIETKSQVINLIVSEADKNLRIEG